VIQVVRDEWSVAGGRFEESRSIRWQPVATVQGESAAIGRTASWIPGRISSRIKGIRFNLTVSLFKIIPVNVD
jgi:hypothetical protein